MKLPRWNGTRPGTYLFSLVGFIVGYGVVKVFSLGRVTHDDREGPSWNPVSECLTDAAASRSSPSSAWDFSCSACASRS